MKKLFCLIVILIVVFTGCDEQQRGMMKPVIDEVMPATDTDQYTQLIEAEAADVIKAPMVIANDPDASGGQFIWMEGLPRTGGGYEGWAEYNVYIPKPGTYTLWGKVIAWDGESDSFSVTWQPTDPDENAQETQNTQFRWITARGSVWHWDRINQWLDSGIFERTWKFDAAGETTLRIAVWEDGTMLDAIYITDNLSMNPDEQQRGMMKPVIDEVMPATDTDQYTQLIEAEAADVIKAPMVITNDPDASGGQFIWMEGRPRTGGGYEGWAEYTVHIPKPGTYALWGKVIAWDGESDSFWVTWQPADPDENAQETQNTQFRWITARGSVWHWDRINQWLNSGIFERTWKFDAAGETTLRIAVREDGTMLDAIYITDNLSMNPADVTLPVQ